jgi:hypothetical protein
VPILALIKTPIKLAGYEGVETGMVESNSQVVTHRLEAIA